MGAVNSGVVFIVCLKHIDCKYSRAIHVAQNVPQHLLQLDDYGSAPRRTPNKNI